MLRSGPLNVETDVSASVWFLACLLFDAEDGEGIYLLNANLLLMAYTALFP